MNKQTVGALLMLLLAPALTVCCEETVGSFADLNLELAPASKLKSATGYVLPMQVLPVAVTLRNRAPYPVVGHVAIDPNLPLLSVRIAGPGTDFVHYTLTNYAVVSSAVDVREIPPGYAKSVVVNLWCGRSRDAESGEQFFVEPGDYRVKAVLRMSDSDEEIESNIIPVSVLEPMGEEQRAWALWSENTRRNIKEDGTEGRSMFGSPKYCDNRSWRWRLYSDIIRLFPGTSYADYGRYAIGMTCGDTQEEAARHLEKVSSKRDFPMREDALYYLFDSEMRKANTEKAGLFARELKTAYPDSALGRSAASRMRKARKP